MLDLPDRRVIAAFLFNFSLLSNPHQPESNHNQGKSFSSKRDFGIGPRVLWRRRRLLRGCDIERDVDLRLHARTVVGVLRGSTAVECASDVAEDKAPARNN